METYGGAAGARPLTLVFFEPDLADWCRKIERWLTL